MRFVKATERLPETKNPPYLVIVRWVTKGEHLNVATMTPNQLADKLRWDIAGVYEWLDESIPASIEQEANRLYPHPQETYVSPDGVTKMYSNDNKCKAEGYITAARQYMGEIEKLRAENEKMRKALEEIAQKYADAEVIDDIGQFVFEMGEIATSALKTTTHG